MNYDGNFYGRDFLEPSQRVAAEDGEIGIRRYIDAIWRWRDTKQDAANTARAGQYYLRRISDV